jgi:hypothetical protein
MNFYKRSEHPPVPLARAMSFRELQDLREKAIIWQCQIRGKSPWSSECTEAVRPHLPA